jgi:hypothetical protein
MERDSQYQGKTFLDGSSFSIIPAEAMDLIDAQRRDYSRRRVSNEHWQIVQHEIEAQGYDRDAYEHQLEIALEVTVKRRLGTRSHEGF